MTSEGGDTVTLHTGERATVAYVFTHWKMAGDLVVEVDGRREIVLAGEYTASRD